MEDMLCIQATTLDELIEAIETSGRITVRIQKTPQGADEYVIAKSTLVKIADEVRAIEGTIEKIPGAELAARIRALQQTLITIKLATPVIALYDENGKIEPEYDTTAILGNAILGYAILGNGGNTVKLDTPVIYLYDDGVEDETVIEKLATPVIYLYEDTDEEPEVTILKLATPVIELVVENETEDDGGEVEPTIIQLDTPIIYLEEVTDDSEEDEPEVTIIQLATPVIELYEETVEPEEPAVTVIQLVTPVIYLEEIKEDIPDEPTIVQLDTPVIYLEVIEEEEEEPDVPDVPEEPTVQEFSLSEGQKYQIVAPNGVVGLKGTWKCVQTGEVDAFVFTNIEVESTFVFDSSIEPFPNADETYGVQLATSIGNFVLKDSERVPYVYRITSLIITGVNSVTPIEE